MKRTLLLFSAMIISSCAYSQTPDIFKNRSLKDYKKNYSYKKSLFPLTNKEVIPFDEQVNGVVKLRLSGERVRNNGKGLNIYAMQPGNMPCLVPDSTFKSNMPVTINNKFNVSLTPDMLNRGSTKPLNIPEDKLPSY